MAITVKHQYVSTAIDDVDTSVVRPSDWNATHTVDMGANKLLGRNPGGAGPVEEITLGGGLALTGTTLNVIGVADGDKGDITVSGGGTSWTIDTHVVNYVNLQNASSPSVLIGRGAAGAGIIQEITLGANLTMTGTVLAASGGSGGTTLTASKLAGRGAASGTGAPEEITLGTNLTMVGTTLNAASGGGGAAGFCAPQGRLTLQAGTPVMTTTQSAKTTIFYSAFAGDQVPIYNGTTWTMTAITSGEISVATTDTTKSPAAVGASQVLDWFVWSDAGTLRVGHGPAWTSDTARSAGTALVRVNGIWLNSVSITNGPAASRGTYVGTTFSNASSQIDWIYGGFAAGGTEAKLGVWNAYNRRRVATYVGDTATSYTYATNTIRAANGSATMRATFASGLSEDCFSAHYYVSCFNTAGQGNSSVGIGFNTTTAYSGLSGSAGVNTQQSDVTAMYSGAALGKCFMSACELCATGTTTFLPKFAGAGIQTGLQFEGWF